MYDWLSLQVSSNYQFGLCRGIVTKDVLVKGLSRGAIATRKLKGVNRDKGHERFYTSSAHYDEGKSLRLVVFGIAGVSITKRLIRWLGYQSLVSCPKLPPGRPLIYTG